MGLRIALGIDLHCRKRVGAERFGNRVTFFVGFGCLPRLVERLNQERAIFSIVGFALNGFAERSGGGVEVVGAKREQTLVEGIVVFVGIEFDGVLEVGLGVLRFALAREGEAEIVENFRKISAGDRSIRVWSFVTTNGILKRDENLLGFVGLIELQAADADGEIGFNIVGMGFGHATEPWKRGVAIAATSVGFAERERGIGPGGVEARGFAQFAKARLVIIGKQAADEVLERVQTQRAQRFRKVGEIERIGFVVGNEGMPDDFGLHVHERGERASFADGRNESRRIDAKEMRFDGEIRAVRIERSEDDVVSVEILGDAEHGGARELRRRWETVTLEFAGAAGMGIGLFACVGEILDGEFFEAFTEPVEARG